MFLLLKEYLEYLEILNFAKTTLETKRWTLKYFIEFCHDRSIEKPTGITKELITRYQKHLFVEKRKDGKSRTVQMQSRYLREVKLFVDWLLRENHIFVDCTKDLILPKLAKRLPRNIFDESEVKQVMAVPNLKTPVGFTERTILEFFYSTSIRRAELVNLNVRDVHFDQGYVFIAQGKGQKDRIVPIGKDALSWLEKYLSDIRSRLVQNGDEQALFVSSRGSRFTYSSMTSKIADLIKKAKLEKGGSCHQFRRASATHMAQGHAGSGGIDVMHLQNILGHADLRTTQMYIDMAIEEIKKAHEKYHPSERKKDSK